MNSESGSAKKLELEENLPFQRREWRIQTVGWCIWAMLLVAAGVGLLGGSGPLSHQQLNASDGSMELTYDRFVHHHNPTRLELRLNRPEGQDGKIGLRIGQELLDAVQIRRVHPEPENASIEADGAVFNFRLGNEADVGKITFYVEYEAMGKIAGELQLVGAAPIRFSQFIYP